MSVQISQKDKKQRKKKMSNGDNQAMLNNQNVVAFPENQILPKTVNLPIIGEIPTVIIVLGSIVIFVALFQMKSTGLAFSKLNFGEA